MTKEQSLLDGLIKALSVAVDRADSVVQLVEPEALDEIATLVAEIDDPVQRESLRMVVDGIQRRARAERIVAILQGAQLPSGDALN